jgi:hypothetical protein
MEGKNLPLTRRAFCLAHVGPIPIYTVGTGLSPRTSLARLLLQI